MDTLVANAAKIADQVWIALALLTRENPTRSGFSGTEIRECVRREFGSVPPGRRVPHFAARRRHQAGQP